MVCLTFTKPSAVKHTVSTIEESPQRQDSCLSPNARSNPLSRTFRAASAGLSGFASRNQTATCSFVSSFRTLSSPPRNFHTSPPSTPPATNPPGGERIKFVMASFIGADYTQNSGALHADVSWKRRPTACRHRSDTHSGPISRASFWRRARCHLLSLGGRNSMKTW